MRGATQVASIELLRLSSTEWSSEASRTTSRLRRRISKRELRVASAMLEAGSRLSASSSRPVETTIIAVDLTFKPFTVLSEEFKDELCDDPRARRLRA